MSDTATTTEPTTTPPATTTGAKKTRAPLTYKLVAIEKTADGGVAFTEVAQPKIEKDIPRRDDFRRAVKKALEGGDEAAVIAWNGKQLTVIGYPEPFTFDAKVEEEVVRKVVITES